MAQKKQVTRQKRLSPEQRATRAVRMGSNQFESMRIWLVQREIEEAIDAVSQACNRTKNKPRGVGWGV